jgi:hypothetical protein
MIDIVAELKNSEVVMRAVKRLGADLAPTVAGGMDRGLSRIADLARVKAPTRTGRLRAALTHEISVRSNPRVTQIVGRVGTNVKYAQFVERGTGLHGPYRQRIFPKEKQALAWVISGTRPRSKTAWRKAAQMGRAVVVKHTAGMRPKPYLVPAFDQGASEFVDEIIRAVNRRLPR